MNVLLTGGTGYIGSHTAVTFAEAGHRIVLFDNLANSQRSVVARLGEILGTEPLFVEGDIRDTAKLEDVLRRERIDAVIHFAGLKAVGESVQNPIDYFDNNVGGTLSLLRAMRAVGTKTIVFSSSATVYGHPQYLPIDEQHPLSATNPYGRSKLHIEEILSDVAASDPTWKVICLRYFNPVGAHASGLIGENPNGIPNNLMPLIAQVAWGKLPALSVFGDDYDTKDGTGVRDYIHVLDLAAGHLAALDFVTQTSGWHAVNLGTGTGYSVLEMVRAFETASGRSVLYRIAPRRPGDAAACFAHTERAATMLGWNAQRTLEDMCRSTWHWQSVGYAKVAG